MSPSVTTPQFQHTLARAAQVVGHGVHSGNQATLTLCPADENTGIIFVRTDLKNGARIIPARWDRVADTRLCTVLANDEGGRVGTVEHLMAALSATGIDNATVEIDGPEVPIMDGSADAFIAAIDAAGLVQQKAARKTLVVLKPVEVQDKGRIARLEPDDAYRFSLTIEFPNTPIARQSYDFDLSSSGFKGEISRARTFGFYEEGEQLRALGLGLGCSLDNTVVIKDQAIMNPEGLRFPNEFVRHKLLDAIGDLALAGAPLAAAFSGSCTGHAMNNRLLRALFATDGAWSFREGA